MSVLRLLLVLFCLSITACSSPTQPSQLLDLAPEDAAVYLNIQDLPTLRTTLNNHPLSQTLNANDRLQSVTKALKSLAFVQPEGESLLCITEVGKNNFEYLLITRESPQLFALDSSVVRGALTLDYQGNQFKKLQIDQNELYFRTLEDFVLLSSSQLLIENSIRKQDKALPKDALQKLLSTASRQSDFTIILQLPNASSLLDRFFMPKTLANWTTLYRYAAMDVSLENQGISANGIQLFQENLQRSQLPQGSTSAFQAPMLAPASAAFISSEINPPLSGILKDSLPDGLAEVTEIQTPEGSVYALRTIPEESVSLSEFINTSNASEEYRGIPISSVENSKWLADQFSERFKEARIGFVAQMENLMLLSADRLPLESVISQYQNNLTLSQQPSYQSLKSRLPDEGHRLIHLHLQEKLKDSTFFQPEFGQVFQEDYFEKHPYLEIQTTYDSDFALFQLALSGSGSVSGKAVEGMVSQRFLTKLDAPLISAPVFVKNHRTKGMDIVVQDRNLQLYLISSEGKVYWKKQLEEPVLGSIQQVDLYRNGRWQLAFTTASKLHIIDRNGNVVPPFPLSFKDPITQPLGIFDYDGSKNYRFAVVQDRTILLFNREGKSVNGFSFTSPATIVSPPKHIRLGNRDFITVNDASGNMHLLHRTGDVRLKGGQSKDVGSVPVYLYDETFTTITSKGELLQIDGNGKSVVTATGLSPTARIDATAKTLVTLSDNKLTIKGKTLELDFGLYTAPRIFYLYDKIYVSLTDTQANKVYLFDSQGALIPNFPLYGTSAADLTDMDNDRKPELTVKGEDDSVIVYSLP